MTEDILEYRTVLPAQVTTWYPACRVEDFPKDGGLCISYRGLQIAVFNFTRRQEWYATQNLCPHKHQMILSRGMIGSEGDEPKVACPFHKKTFSLKTGANLNGNECELATYPVKVENGTVLVGFA
ncbi:nitrite reductase small subunit NirD [Marinoscillum sp. 108]|jgi:nitrite reductase (NADH) small subunit|uniref:Nitrite reductase small subunit NirD n=1 Tax=Marinoscillum luteum TaxID=861051 RepID=A0ABW7NGG0_9BACT|nr:nitrite reductase small subunit NirD [Marinoscillum sp. 108]VXD13929.1 Assimilatory nitrite reductase (NAD(P)H) small subunit [Marinoscillum sp. 108]